MTTHALPGLSSDVSVFTPEAEAAWNALNSRFADRLSAVELDYLYALFILGLTSPTFAEGEPVAHLEICRALLELQLPPDRVHSALHTVPQPAEPWVISAFETIERRGVERGHALVQQNPTEKSREAREAVAGASSAVAYKEETP